jgi:hypothetical protein
MLKMKRLILLSMLGLLMMPHAEAQLWKSKRYEATAGLGTSQFYGDVGGYTIGENALGFRDITLKQTRFNVSGTFRYFILDEVAARLSLYYVMLKATDIRGSNEVRGYEALTSVFEPAVIGEYYIIRNRERNSYSFQTYRGRSRNHLKDFFKSIDFYALAGVGGASYGARVNEALDLRDQKNSGFTAVIPLGLGAKVTFDPNILLGIELCGRYSFSDHIDGYTSVWSARNDVYQTFSFTFNYRIKTARNGLPSFK